MTIIRPARPDDAPVLSALARSAYARYVEDMGTHPAPMCADYAAAIVRTEVWVAENDGILMGLLVLDDRTDHLLLDNVAVAPRAQGTGLGSRLLDLAEQRARALGHAEIRLYTNELMTDNLRYYAHRGYTETHRSEQHGYRRVFFRKRLRR